MQLQSHKEKQNKRQMQYFKLFLWSILIYFLFFLKNLYLCVCAHANKGVQAGKTLDINTQIKSPKIEQKKKKNQKVWEESSWDPWKTQVNICYI